MKLILLGTAGYHPNEQRETACLLLPQCGVILDAGTGMYRAGRYLETSRLDVFLTHAHLDHVVGLTYLFNVVRAHPLDQIDVHGEEEKLRAVEEHLLAEAIFPARPPCRFVPLTQEVLLPAGGRLSYFPVPHQGGSIGYRLDWPGHSLAYVTDTTADPDADYVEAIRGVDLLVHECYFPDWRADWARQTGHSHTTPVAAVARKAEAGRLVLVHVDPAAPEADPIGLDVARAIFPNTILGEDLVEIDF